MQEKQKKIAKLTLNDFSQSNDSFTEQRPFEKELIEQMYKSKVLMSQFIQSLGNAKDTPIKDMIFKYCGKYRQFFISPENVLILLEKRIQRMIKNKRIKRNWSDQDSQIIIWTLSKYMQRQGIIQIDYLNRNDWKNIAILIPGALPDACMFKILSLKKIKLSEKKWTQEESQLLLHLVSYIFTYFRIKQNKNWRVISHQLYKMNKDPKKIFRNAKQCKEHWTCYLNPELKKGPWDAEEDKILLQYVLENEGKKKWADLAKMFRGRTENALKNRYSLIVEREKKENISENQLQLIANYLKKLRSDDNIPNSNKKRRCTPRTKIVNEQPEEGIFEEAQEPKQPINYPSPPQLSTQKKEEQKSKEITSNNVPVFPTTINGVRGDTVYPIVYPNNNFIMMFVNPYHL